LLRPKLEYCVQSWRPFSKKDIEKLERIQHRATKMIQECKGLNYEDRLQLTGLPTLEDRRNRRDLIQVFQIIKKIDNLEYNQFF